MWLKLYDLAPECYLANHIVSPTFFCSLFRMHSCTYQIGKHTGLVSFGYSLDLLVAVAKVCQMKFI